MQTSNRLILGQYEGGDFALFGNISNVVVIFEESNSIDVATTNILATMKLVDIESIAGVQAYFPLEEVS